MPSPAVIINVDDHEAARYAKGRVLSRAGFIVHDAGCGADALRLISQHSPDLVLLDINLPDVNGIEVCRRIKSSSDGASVIVLQISATARAAPQATAALDSGADAYLAEPVDPDVLISTIKALLRLRGVERQLSAANERLKVLNEELQRSNEDLQQFAFAASHDLQEPLRTVTSFATLLQRAVTPKLAATELEYLRFILDGARRMRLLIEDLLSYSQVGHRPNSSSPVALDVVLASTLENLREGIVISEAQIETRQLPTVIGDEAQLGQLLQNLIGNAIKYRRPGVPPVIQIGARQTNRHWVIEVSDNGIGIGPNHLQEIFGAFKRLHGKEIPGTGIGLAVCRKVVEAHGGTIWAESTPGVGATFSFTLPLAAD